MAGFPLGAAVVAVLLFVTGAAAAPGPPAPVVISGTDGAQLISIPGALVPTDPSAPGGTATYGVVHFSTPSGTSHPIQGSTSLALPPYLGWEANGSAGSMNGKAAVGGGLLHVEVRRPTTKFRGWFLTTTGSIPDSCAFQFETPSPPAVPSSADHATGEIVMAVQTANTVSTGDINYVVVAEVVHGNGQRTLQAGYSTGHVRNAMEHVLVRVPWAPGPLQVAIETNGENDLEVWVDGWPLVHDTELRMGIAPPFQPYLEVQATATPYSVGFARYASVCGDNVVVRGLPAGSRVALGRQLVSAHGGRAVFALDRNSGPVTAPLVVRVPDRSRPVRFPTHAYWPGDRFVYRSRSAA